MSLTTDFLSFIASPSTIDQFSLAQQHILIRGARKAGLLASIAIQLQQDEACWRTLDEGIRRHLHSALIYSQRQHQQIRHEMNLLQTILVPTPFRCYFLKGAGYVVRGDNIHGGRIMSDIDVLVERRHLNNVEALLKQHRWVGKQVSDYDDKYYREWAHEIPPMLNVERNTTLDLHHNLVPPVSNRMPDASWFTQDAIAISDNIYVLRPAATLLHSAVHLIMNEEFHHGLRDLADIHKMLLAYDGDAFWDDLLSLARQAKFQQELLYTLQLHAQIWPTTTNAKTVISQLQQDVTSPSHGFWLQAYRWAIVPEIEELDSVKSRAARFLCFLRGHSQKMPLPILIRHLSFKTYLQFKQKVLGQQPQV